MATTLDLVYQYRLLTGKCQSGRGLTVDEIDTLITLESFFGVDRADDTDLFACRRAFNREPVDLTATLRNKRLGDKVHVIELGPGGLVATGTPYVEKGDRIEVVFDDEELRISYRFSAEVVWVDEDGDDYTCGLEITGTPVLVRKGPARAKTAGDGDTYDGETRKFDRAAA